MSAQRQEELSKRRAVRPDVAKGNYPFSGMELNRADIEWLLATHGNGRRGLDLRGADVLGSKNQRVELAGLPLAALIGGLTGDQQSRMSGVNSGGHFQSYLHGPNRNQFVQRLPPSAGAGQVHQVQNEPVGLVIKVAINQAGTFNFEGNILLGDPAHEIAEEVPVIREVIPRETTIQVCRQEGDTGAGGGCIQH